MRGGFSGYWSGKVRRSEKIPPAGTARRGGRLWPWGAATAAALGANRGHLPAARTAGALTLPRRLVWPHHGGVPLENVVLGHWRRAHSLRARESNRDRPSSQNPVDLLPPRASAATRHAAPVPAPTGRSELTGAASSAILRRSLARRSMATFLRATLAPVAAAPVPEPVPPDEPSEEAAAAAAGRGTTGASSAMDSASRTGLECNLLPASSATEPSREIQCA